MTDVSATIPTPRTDYLFDHKCGRMDERQCAFTLLAHARQLERELAEAKAVRPEVDAIPEGCTPADAMVLREANHHFAEENQALRRCLRWYANGEHIVGFSTWEGPSGDDNWLCPPMADFGDYRQKFIDTLDEHMVEDGAVARGTLRSGKFEVESPEDEPKVIEGEPEWLIEQQAHSSPPRDTMSESIAKQIENGAPGDSQSNR